MGINKVSQNTLNPSLLLALAGAYCPSKERCVAKPESYEERKARREAEITGLKEALEILESSWVATARPVEKRDSRMSG